MLDRKLIQCLGHSEEFEEPRAGRHVWPNQICHAFQKRYSAFPVVPGCFFANTAILGWKDLLRWPSGFAAGRKYKCVKLEIFNNMVRSSMDL